MALTAKQALFVKEYLVDLNATGAAVRAGYSEKTATIIGHENLRKPNIAEAIETAQKRRAEKVHITAEWVLNKYIGIIERCEQTDPQTARGALDSVGKHLGMFKDKVEHSGMLGVNIINDIPKRST